VSSKYRPVAEFFDSLMNTVYRVGVCGCIIQYRTIQLIGKVESGKSVYSHAFDPLARKWPTEAEAIKCVKGSWK